MKLSLLNDKVMNLLTLILFFVLGITVTSFFEGTFTHKLFYESHLILGIEVFKIG